MILENNFINLKAELSNAVVAFERGESGYNLFFNNHDGFQEFKRHLNHLYYEFIKEVQNNLLEVDTEKGIHIYLEMLLHLFELLDEQIGTYPDFVTPHRNTKMISRINTKVTCIHTNPDDLNQLLIYFQHQKKIIRKSIKFIQVFKEKCSVQLKGMDSNVLTWKDELKDFYPEMTRLKNEMDQIDNIPGRIEYLQNERERLNLEYQKQNKSLYSSSINFFFESRIECMKDVLVLENGRNKSQKENHIPAKSDDKNKKVFMWTESKAALVELIYAIYYSNALDKSKSSIKELAGLFEHFFDIDLGDIYHIFHELKNRKLEPTKFIDSLKSAFLRKIEEEMER